VETTLTAEELRKMAQFVERSVADTLAELEDHLFPVGFGNAREFTRERPEDRAALRGLNALRQSAENTAATLNTLAVAAERDIEIAPVIPLLLNLQPLVDVFKRPGVARPMTGGSASRKGNDTSADQEE
jgi:hypothetical protein